MVVKIRDLVGQYCVSRAEGNKVYEYIKHIWDKSNKITLSFEGVDISTLSFFNAAFSPFVFDHPIDDIRNKLTLTNLSEKDKFLLNKSIKAALDQRNKISIAN